VELVETFTLVTLRLPRVLSNELQMKYDRLMV
jgi:hypothetical protein